MDNKNTICQYPTLVLEADHEKTPEGYLDPFNRPDPNELLVKNPKLEECGSMPECRGCRTLFSGQAVVLARKFNPKSGWTGGIG